MNYKKELRKLIKNSENEFEMKLLYEYYFLIVNKKKRDNL
jgi:hypothetical protein